ncbi:glycoside hydrolase family 3 protein [Francisella hispaniensis]|uniref:glycoside hydrolase family 3 protein n=1 Tax=Francisella hispaniensis TaxID=622488 RepID=UPI0019056FFB|nr:glycoside hydrolase family 3 protein [Francisella hispaniensis]MBK2357577.1 glycoside hydrolase family 3 protein [Francisella hispaniensis]
MIGQMLIVGFSGQAIDEKSEIVQHIKDNNIGGVILFDRKGKDNIKSPEQLETLNSNLQKYNNIYNDLYMRPQVPLIIAIDYEGGKVNRLKAKYGFPETFTAKKFSELDIQEQTHVAREMAETMYKVGINLNLAPCVDIHNDNCPIIGKYERSFSTDVNTIVDCANLFCKATEKRKIGSVLKHFPGHGSSTNDSHLGAADITNTWTEKELIPYIKLLPENKHCMVMTAHVMNRKIDETNPATLSSKIIKILRTDIKFDGVIISDAMEMKAVTEYYGELESLKLAINAGVNMFIFSDANPDTIIDNIAKLVESGEVAEATIKESYENIIAYKQNYLTEETISNNLTNCCCNYL